MILHSYCVSRRYFLSCSLSTMVHIYSTPSIYVKGTDSSCPMLSMDYAQCILAGRVQTVRHYYLKQLCANPAGEASDRKQVTAAGCVLVGVRRNEDRRESRSSSAPQVGGYGLVHQGASGGCCRVPAKRISTLPPNRSQSLQGYR